MKIEKYHVDKTYNEIDRRISDMIYKEEISQEEIHEVRNNMLQGVYCTFIMIADNWQDVRHWCDVCEEERGYFEVR